MVLKLGQNVEDDRGNIWRLQLKVEDYLVGIHYQLVSSGKWAVCYEDGSMAKSRKWPDIGTKIVRIINEPS